MDRWSVLFLSRGSLQVQLLEICRDDSPVDMSSNKSCGDDIFCWVECKVKDCVLVRERVRL